MNVQITNHGEKMHHIIDEFISAMDSAGLSPARSSDIKADNQRHDYQLSSDPKSKKKGYYKLKIDGDFGFGFFGDYRGDNFIKWHSKAKSTLTPEQIKEFHKKREAEEQAAQAERQGLWDKRADEAEDLIIFLEQAKPDHPYLARKGIKPYCALQSGQSLIIPIGDDLREIWSYQEILPDGDKLFCGGKRGSRVFGCWATIEGDATVCIAEGFATAASIHEATGHTVVIAWSAANVPNIAPKIAEKYKGQRIVVCADNDIHKIDPKTGHPFQTGLKAGEKAARLIGAFLAFPVFKDNDKKGSDFNDLHQQEGLQLVKNQIQEAGRKFAPEQAAGGFPQPVGNLQTPGGDPPPVVDDWQEGLQLTKKGEIIPRSTTNLLLITANDEELNGVFVYDSFAKHIIVLRCPPWEDESLFKVRQLQDFDYVRLESFLEKKWHIMAGKNKVADAIESTATLPFNTINPASDYFNAQAGQWDGVERLNTWLFDFVSDRRQPKAYLTIVGRKFMCGLAARAMTPGVKFDTMIILEGRQNAGKSYLSRIMATINGEEYFLDDFKDIENKDALIKMQGKLVVEFPEISTMRKTEVNDLKGFLSRNHDVFRPPYGRNKIESGRQCVFVGTVNPEGPYLRDVTENRRYWPVSCRDKINIEDLKKIMPQLHAEAAHLVKSGEQLWLLDEEYALCAVEQSKRVVTDIWIDKIEEIVRGSDEIATDDILMQLGIAVDKRSQITYARLMQSMTALGFVSDRVGSGRSRKRGYRRIGSQAPLIQECAGGEIAW